MFEKNWERQWEKSWRALGALLLGFIFLFSVVGCHKPAPPAPVQKVSCNCGKHGCTCAECVCKAAGKCSVDCTCGPAPAPPVKKDDGKCKCDKCSCYGKCDGAPDCNKDTCKCKGCKKKKK